MLLRMQAQTLNCYACGAAVQSDAPSCQYCKARLATIGCPSCFGMLFSGSKFCPHCGALSAEWDAEDSTLICPRCDAALMRGVVGKVVLHECSRCLGVWIGKNTFEEVCRNHEHHAAVLGEARALPAERAEDKVRYVACPDCRELMNRVNFARCSGVIIDACRKHGSWFDVNELQRIVQFIRSGGLTRAREVEKAELKSAQRAAESARQSRTPIYDRPTFGRERGWLELLLESASDLILR